MLTWHCLWVSAFIPQIINLPTAAAFLDFICQVISPSPPGLSPFSSTLGRGFDGMSGTHSAQHMNEMLRMGEMFVQQAGTENKVGDGSKSQLPIWIAQESRVHLCKTKTFNALISQLNHQL